MPAKLNPRCPATAPTLHSVEAILREASDLGLPRHWATDLQIDRAILEAERPDRFVWMLYDCGTHLYSLRTDNVERGDVWASFPFCVYYLYQWDSTRLWYTYNEHQSPALSAVTPHQWFAFYIWAVRGGKWDNRDINIETMPERPSYGLNGMKRDNCLSQLRRLAPDYRRLADERRDWLRQNGTPPMLRASPAMLAAGENARLEYV